VIVNQRLITAAALILITVAVVSCSRIRVVENSRFPEAAADLAVTPFNQEPEQCGPFALAAVINYLGGSADPMEMAGRLHSPSLRGTLTMDLFLEAGRRGFKAEQGAGKISAVKEHIEDGRPVILLLRYASLLGRVGHYIVVRGYSRDPAGYFVLWGDGRVSWMEEEQMTKMWRRSDNWMLSWGPGP
jgi:hypothetical protein